MKVRIFYSIDKGVYSAAVHTEDWSEDEVALMAEHGDPEISVSGTLVLFPVIVGSNTEGTGSSTLQDLSKSWTTNKLKGRTIWNRTKSQVGTVTSNTKTSLTSVIGSDPMLWDHDDNYEITQVVTTLAEQEKDMFRVRADSPIIMSFDNRDYPYVDPMTGVFTTAENMTNGWAYTVSGRIGDARSGLLALGDGFAREEVVTYE